MPRYMILEGKKGVLVPDPRGRGRYIGQKVKSNIKEGTFFKEHYEPNVVAMPFELTWVKAVKKGKLTCHGVCSATDITEAIKVPRSELSKFSKDGSVERKKNKVDDASDVDNFGVAAEADIYNVTGIKGAE